MKDHLEYSGTTLKTEDGYFAISKEVAKLMNREKISLSFDEHNLSLCFFGIEEIWEKKPNFIKFNKTNFGKSLISKDANITLKDGHFYLNPFKILITKKVDNFLYSKNVSLTRGKIDMKTILVLYHLKKLLKKII